MKKLIGRKIKSIIPMDETTAQAWGWYKRPFIIVLDDGTRLIPQADDEGNDGGAVAVLHPDGSDDMLYTN
jgi:hypothetical protein